MNPTAPETDELRLLREETTRLRARLAAVRGWLRRQMVVEFALDLAAGLALAGAVLVTLDAALRLGPTARQMLLASSLLGIVAVVAIRSVPRVRAARLDDLALALTLDRVRPGTGQQVADVLQLPDELSGPRSTASPALVRLAVGRASESLASVSWSDHWNHDRSAGRVLALVGALLAPLAFYVVAPDVAGLSYRRWLRGSNERWPQRTYLSVAGLGDGRSLLAPRDEPFAIEIRADMPGLTPEGGGYLLPGRGVRFPLRAKPAKPSQPESIRLRERAADGSVRDTFVTAIAPGLYRHELPPSSGSSTIELVGGDDWLGPVRVDRVDRPSVQAMSLRVRDPGRARGQFRPVEDLGPSPIFLPDTEVELTLVGSEPIAVPHLDVHPGHPPRLDRKDPKSYAARWTLREATTLEVQVTSEATGLSSKPAFLSIGLLKDREPRVTLRTQGVGAHVTPVATIPLVLGATDDLGLGSLRLQVERTVHPDEKAEPVITKQSVPIPMESGGRAVLDHQARHDVDLQNNKPPIGAVLRLQAEAEDRCARGPQVGRSGTVLLQVVSPDELFYEILIRQRAERSKFLAALDDVEKQSPALSGAPATEDYLALSRNLHTASRQLEQIASRIADTLQEMKLNQVGSPKSHRLLQDGVIEPIRRLTAGSMNELRTALQALGGAGVRSGGDREKARRLHIEVVSRMKVILDQMSQWESFVDVVNQVAEVIKIQQKVLKATQDARESRTQEVFDEKKP